MTEGFFLLLYMALYRHRVVSLSSDVLVPGQARTAVIMICVKCGTARLWCGVEFDDNVLAAMGGAAGREFTRPFVGSTLAFVTVTE